MKMKREKLRKSHREKVDEIKWMLESQKDKENNYRKTLSDLDDRVTFNRSLYLGIILGIAGNLLVTLLYDTTLKELSIFLKSVIGIFLVIILSIIIKAIMDEEKILRKEKNRSTEVLRNYKRIREEIKEEIRKPFPS